MFLAEPKCVIGIVKLLIDQTKAGDIKWEWELREFPVGIQSESCWCQLSLTSITMKGPNRLIIKTGSFAVSYDLWQENGKAYSGLWDTLQEHYEMLALKNVSTDLLEKDKPNEA